jgi:hypothetical protein
MLWDLAVSKLFDDAKEYIRTYLDIMEWGTVIDMENHKAKGEDVSCFNMDVKNSLTIFISFSHPKEAQPYRPYPTWRITFQQ